MDQQLSLGVIITNRDRTGPLDACLCSLAVQHTSPAWVVLADLGSQPPHRAELLALAGRYGVSYLGIDHAGAWNKSLAFNTAFRRAMTCLPAVSHVIQLDADAILHPGLLSAAAEALRTAAAFWCAPRMAPPGLMSWPVPGEVPGFERMIAQCGPVVISAVGVFMVLPSAWVARRRGFDEDFTGWGHEDIEIWCRARNSLACAKDTSGSMLIHQWHQRQAGAGLLGPNWPRLTHRMANPGAVTNPAGWGNGRIVQSVLRPGVARPSAPTHPRLAACRRG
jgi:hypothetical protein